MSPIVAILFDSRAGFWVQAFQFYGRDISLIFLTCWFGSITCLKWGVKLVPIFQ